MPRKRTKELKYKSIEDFPDYRITATMISQSYIGISAAYVRNGVKNGTLKGYNIGRNCYMSKEQLIENFSLNKIETWNDLSNEIIKLKAENELLKNILALDKYNKGGKL